MSETNPSDFEKKLLEENRFLKRILALVPESIYWKNTENIYLGCNKAQSKILGFSSPEEIVGKTNYDIDSQEQAKKIDDTDSAIMLNGKTLRKEENVLINGEEKTYLSTKTPISDEDGKITGLVGISIDITDKKRNEILERKLLLSEERLKVARLLSASIAHEIRTPLARFSIDLQLLKHLSDNEASLLAINNLFNALQATHHTIDMLLLKSKADHLKIEKMSVLSIKELITKAIEDYPFGNGHKELVKANLEEDFNIYGNEFYFKHILFNLIKNSIYAIQKAQKGQIIIKTNSTDRTITFKDTGCGIPEDILPHIYDSFYTQSDRGTGVGLALCKQIMKAFNGNFSCKTQLNEFTEFKMHFPEISEQ